ncbi:hypothetical protein [Flavobacterium sp. ZT3R18]|uniref:hypothetical protein n=1 Tax=Flavobacterium sp. ZT3R18 TaxID=2594429 RepID=UPI00163D6F3A|nr:hypothetical protein [Flavobacterium sp. ZT3R18]
MLKLGGYINILIAIGHIVGLIWANQMFEITGIGNEMATLALKHSVLPYLSTIFVAIVFFVFGLYGLSADHKFRKLPFLKTVLFLIAGLYLLRGLGELIADQIQGTNTMAETMYSLFALAIGLLFLIGGLEKRKIKNNNYNESNQPTYQNNSSTKSKSG